MNATRALSPAGIPLILALSVVLASAAGEALAADEGVIRGSVSDQAGRPLGSATIVVQPLGRETRTGIDGGFELAGVPAGDYRLEARAAGHAIEVLEPVTVVPGEMTVIDLRLTAVAVPVGEILVTARHSLLREEPITVVNMDREEITELPHFGDDLYRAIAVLPGTSAKDFSARFSVRGGLHDDVLVRLDGLELFEPFHLKDLDGVFNAVDPEIVGGVDLTPGNFSAEYGDRMGGVLDMWTRRPAERRTSFGISFANAWAGSAGIFGDGRGSWLASARRGYLDLLMSFVGEEQGRDEEDDWSPRYWDLFGKLERDLTASQTLSFKVLLADDALMINQRDAFETTDVETSFGNLTLGLDHRAILGQRMVAQTILSAARVDRDRFFRWSERDEWIAMDDDRKLDVLGLRQDWSFSPSERNYVKWGFEARSYDVEYDYLNDIVDDDFIDDPRFPPPVRATAYAEQLDGEQYALWVADRVRLGKGLTAELGARYDEQTMTDDSQVSPRLNLVYDLGGAGLLRAGWGRFFQSQRAHELNVQFGETGFHPAQSADEITLGYERELPGDHRLRVDAYRREVSDPIPEFEPDLIRIAADKVLAEGVELHLRGPHRPRLDWWLSYTLSSVEDEVDGRWQYRAIDQTHALAANLNYRPTRKWNLSWVWVYHTGWPTTDVEAEAVQMVRHPQGAWQTIYTIGPFYAERLAAYHRLDLRASRTSRMGKGQLTLFIDIQNLYDQENERGLEIDDRVFVAQPDGRLLAEFKEEAWFGFMPSFGISWER
jgi:outer membrane receptor protein involved in Fe transport